MRYLSVCSGIEAATVAWHPLGWEAFAYSEIEKFPCEVLKHHYPQTPNFGDMTKFKEWPDATIDVLVGGTPCQSFSIAGLRKGLDDPRGNLMLTYLAIADKYRPKWLLWENVPGVLSSNGGRDFGSLLGGLAKLGYGFAYRVLDAQYVRTDGHPYAVPQRRKRVFVVGCLGDWRSAAAVLFDRESLSENPPPKRGTFKATTANATAGTGVRGGIASNANVGSATEATGTAVGNTEAEATLIPRTTCSGKDTFGTLMANVGSKQWLGNQEALSGDYHVFALAGNTIGREPLNGGNGNGYDDGGASYTLTKTDLHAVCHPINTMTMMGRPSDDLKPRMGLGIGEDGDPCPTLTKAHSHAVAFKVRGGCEGGGKGYLGSEEAVFTLSTNQDQQIALADSTVMQMRVRRLTPTECARLQGFQDDYLSQVKGASDSAMYKSLGNSMAVNVMQCLGERIQMVENITKQLSEAA
jgi:DNA (cytosine-5)-methyltransferase 1